MAERDPYAVLGVSPGASAEDVRRAYFRLVRQYPPEAHPEEFKQVRAAYETLRSPLRRAELALADFDETAAEVDLDVLSEAAGTGSFDPAELLLAVEWGLADLGRPDFPEDLRPITEDELFRRPAVLGDQSADGSGDGAGTLDATAATDR